MNILKKLTVHNLKRNKVRTAVTILGITLALALITVVVGVFFSAWHSAIQSVILTSGDYDFSLMGEFTPEEVHQIESHRSVRDVYLFKFLEIAKNDDAKYQYTPYIYVYHADEAMLSANFCKLQEGRYPQKDNELLISSTLISHSEREYHVGDQLDLSIGKRVYDFSGDEHQKEMEEMYSTSNMSFYDPYMGQQYEKFNTTGTKTYTIVGILANEGGILNDLFMASSNMPSVFTYSPNGNAQGVYVRLQDSEESKYFQVASEMTGLSESDLEMIGKGQLELGDLNEILASSGKLHNITHFSLNRSLLTIKGLYESHDLQIMVSILAIILGIVFLASVFIIRNSFAISITEKTKLYGMLSSVGATPKQISRNVFFEAAILGIIGIPLGILLGTGVTAGLLAICNALLGKTLGGLTLIFNIPWYAIMLAVLVGAATIFASAAIPARKASKISPIEAIRSTQDVKTNEKKAGKIYRTPKFITKFFGVGGSIAWKNMKRSRRQYRATVISIIVSVAIYLTASSFVDYTIVRMQSQSFYQDSQYNITAIISSGQYDTSENDTISYSFKKIEDNVQTVISKIQDIKKLRYTMSTNYYSFPIAVSDLTEDANHYLDDYEPTDSLNTKLFSYIIVAVDDDSFREICKENGKTYEECKDKGFVHNMASYYPNTSGGNSEQKSTAVMKDPDGMKLKGKHEIYSYELVGEGENAEYQETKQGESFVDIELAGAVDDHYKISATDSTSYFIVVSKEWMEKNLCKDGVPEASIETELLLDVENADAAEEILSKESFEGSGTVTFFNNMERVVSGMRALILLIEIFVYGFILVISLIGLTNIFNTITNNIKLRQKEFATLLSIGTTKKEFNRMVGLESLLYTVKSLLIGLPLGLGAGVVIYLMYGQTLGGMSYIFPWKAVLISILVVLILLWVIMRFSIRKVSKMNVIETIRNDNI